MAKKEMYYTLLLTQSNALLTLVQISDADPVVIRKNHFYFTDFQNLENQLKELLRKEKETNKLILFLTHHYLETKTNTLKVEYKEVFTRVFKSTGLEPIGYIETYEAIVNYLSKKQEFPLNALVIEVEKTSISTTISKGGRVQKTFTKALTDNFEQDLIELLASLSEKPLPAKIYFLNFCEEREEEIEKVEKTRWPKDLFLHHPEVKLLSQEKINNNLIKTFAQELKQPAKQTTEKEPKVEENLPLGFAPSEEDLEKEKTELSINIPSFSLPSLSLRFPNLLNLSKTISIHKLKLIPLLVIFLSLPILAYSHENFFHKATVAIYPKTKEIKIEKTIPFDKNSPIFYLAKEKVEIQKKYEATGEKDVGKKASGTLKFYNFSTKELKLTNKTKITYKNKTYFLTENLTIPPATEETVGGSIIKKPGVKSGKVEAEEIGEKYNLSTSDKLIIGNLDTDLYFAKIEDKISGGTSETVQTVTRSDLQKAREDVKNQALNKINPEKMQLETNRYIPLLDLATSSIIEESFDKELGDISEDFTITATVEVQVPFLDKQALVKEFENEIRSQVGEDYTFDSQKLKVQADVNKSDDQQQATISISISGKAYQKVNILAIKNYLKGRPIKDINTSPPNNISKVKVIKNSAFLPFLSSRLPYKIENIDVQLQY